MAAQRLQTERALIDRQASAIRAATSSQAEAARLLPDGVQRLASNMRSGEAANAAMRGGNIDLAHQTRVYCR